MPPKRPASRKPARKPASGRPRPTKRTGQGRPWSDWRLHLVLLASALLLVGLVVLARRAERPPEPVPEPPPAVRIEALPTAREKAEALLAAAAVPPAAIVREPAEQPRHYRVQWPFPAAALVERLQRSLRLETPPLELARPEAGVLAIVDDQGATLLTIEFLGVPAAPLALAPPPGAGGLVALIMDDLGRGTRNARQLLAIGQPVTFAILPGEPQAREVAELAHAAGREVMLHVPMEPQGYPVIDPGDEALLVGEPDGVLRSRLATLLEQVPYASGINNHMGSRFTEDRRAMTAVMALLRERELFFVDSLTTSRSVGAVTAQGAGVPALRRDVFLDNVAEVAAITQQLHRLAEKARRNGTAVGICHPYPETLEVLRRELPKLAAQGVRFVPVAELLAEEGKSLSR